MNRKTIAIATPLGLLLWIALCLMTYRFGVASALFLIAVGAMLFGLFTIIRSRYGENY